MTIEIIKNKIATFIVNLRPIKWAIERHRKECREVLFDALGENPADYE
jgi:hypothetical protein